MKNHEFNVAFFDAKSYDIQSFNEANTGFGFQLNYIENHLNLETVRYARGSRAICAFVNDDLGAEVLDELDKIGVKLIALRCAGFNNVDLTMASGRFNVVRVPAYSPYAVAEHTLAMIMTLNRKTHRAYFRVRDNNFSLQGLLGFDMHGKTLGVIGTGKIGKTFISIMKGFGMNILAYDKYPDQAFAEANGIAYVEKEEIYRKADIISLHCPLSDETFHMINRQSLSQMKPGVMLVNTSRGKLIDTKNLIEALKSGRVGSAALDVYEEESEYFFVDHSNMIIHDDDLVRLISFNNVLVTSHQAFFTKEALANIAATTLNNIKEFAEGLPLSNEICPKCSG